MSAPLLPSGDTSLPMADSDPNHIPGPIGVGQPVVAARSEVISVVVEQLRIGKKAVTGEGVRVCIATASEEVLPHLTLRFKPERRSASRSAA